MIIALGCDHAGFELKEKIKHHLEKKGQNCHDFGTFNEDSVDYPDYAFYVGKAVASGECQKGILVCGTGIGMSIAVNKIPGIRGALCQDVFAAQATREHNDSNVLALGARIINEETALSIVDVWLKTKFAGGRHEARVEKIKAIEDMMSVERAESLAEVVASLAEKKNKN